MTDTPIDFGAAIAHSLGPIRSMLASHREIRPDGDPVVFLLDPADSQARAVWGWLRRRIPGDWVGPRGADEPRLMVAVVDYRQVVADVPAEVRAFADGPGEGTRILLVADGRTTGGFVRLN
jgi:hypothetical protein